MLSKLKFSRLTLNAFTVASLFLLDKGIAFVRAIIINRQFSDAEGIPILDAFNAANNLPDVLFALISGGALAMAFIPLLTDYLTTKDRAAAWDLFSRVANIAFLVTASFAVIISIFAEPIARMGIAPGFNEDQLLLVEDLMRLNLIATIIFSISGLVAASLQANQHFFLPALAPTLYNVGQIFGAVYLVPRYGVRGLVYGVIIGAAFHLLIQLPGLYKYGFRWTPSLNLRHTGLIEALKLMGPRLLTMGGIQFIVIARDNLASRFDQPGAVTALTNGWMIMQVPETIVGTAIATAMLPAISELAARADWKGFRETIERALQVLISLTLPIATVMGAGILPLIRGAFHFDEATTELVAWTTRAYLLTLTGFTVHEVAVRAFYARKEPLYPLYAVILRVGIFLAIGWVGLTFFREVGAPVIAFAEIALLIESIILFSWLSGRTHEPIRLGNSIIKGIFAALVGGVVTYLIALYLPGGAIATALIGMVVGGLIALAMVWSEAKQMFNL
jgi:putative peptidoglycan lipid II flippase